MRSNERMNEAVRWAFQTVLITAALLGGRVALANGAGALDYERAMTEHERGRYADAATGFERAYEAGFREEAPAYNPACALARAGRTDDAFRWLDKAYDAGFELEDYLDSDRDLRSLRGDPRFSQLEQKVLAGRTSKRQREAERVLRRYAELKSRATAKPHRYDELGHELLRADRYEEAAEAFLTAAKLQDDRATSLYNAACAKSLAGSKAEALAFLQRAVEQGFTSVQMLDEDDDLDAIRSDPHFAEIRALAVELDTPPYLSSWDDRVGKNLRRWREALPQVEAAAKAHPALGLVWFNLGFARIALDRAAEAIAPFQKAVELGYRKATSLYNLACAYALCNRKDDAFDALAKAVDAGFQSWHQFRQDSDLDALRTDPRFQKYLELARQKEREDRDFGEAM